MVAGEEDGGGGGWETCGALSLSYILIVLFFKPTLDKQKTFYFLS